MNATARPPKFNFDLDLARAGAGAAIAAPGKAEMAQLEQRARKRGYTEGEASASARAAEATAAAATKIATRTTAMIAELDSARDLYRRQAAALALGMARKLTRGLIERQPLAEIEALFDECLSSLDHTPHIAIRCNEVLADQIREMAEKCALEQGFSGRLIIIGEPDIKPGDCRIEWADGGIVRDMDAVADTIDHLINAYVGASQPLDSTETTANGSKP
ncbi:MAG: hypothetical protein GXP01_10040 [Alphaproteobacteria bacterium]|nr:hypothetical protein [Alphaproteobacteria bacterium]